MNYYHCARETKAEAVTADDYNSTTHNALASGDIEPVGPAVVHIEESDHPGNQSAVDDTTKSIIDGDLMAVIRTPSQVELQLKRPLSVLQVGVLITLTKTA